MIDGRLEVMKRNVLDFMQQTNLWAAHIDRVSQIKAITDIGKNDSGTLMVGHTTPDSNYNSVPLANVCVDIESARDRMDKLQSEAFDRVVKQVEDRHAEKFGAVSFGDPTEKK